MKTRLLLLLIPAVVGMAQLSSCKVRHDNGKHKGWFKNSKNPHHPASTNPGHHPASRKPAPKPAPKPKK